jgi:putative transposase
MKQEKIQAKMRKKWKVTTRASKKEIMIAPNHLDQNFIVGSPNKVWVSDITYVSTQEGWLYIAVVMDLFSRKVVGLSMSDRLETELVTKALKQALYNRKTNKDLMFHSDRGTQYTSNEFKELANRHGITLSMSAKGRYYDNAVAESFFHTLKTEEVHLSNYRIREEAKTSIFEYVEIFYNRKRLHSTLGYVSPIDFEAAWNCTAERVI